MTKKDLREKWTERRAQIAASSAKLTTKLVGLNAKTKRLRNASPVDRQIHQGEIRKVKTELSQLSVGILLLDEVLNDI